MKSIILVFLFVTAGLFFWFTKTHQTPQQAPQKPTPSPVPSPTSPSTVTWQGETYAYTLFLVPDPRKLTLIPNFSQKKTTETLMDEYRCTASANGGFYDTAGSPLGFFYTNNTLLKPAIHNPLINGFFWINGKNIAGITNAIPIPTPLRLGLQTGPLLVQNSMPLNLSIRNDEHARRVVVARTAAETIIFFAVYQPDNTFQGPNLTDLPHIIAAIGNQEKLPVTDAANLDGGSASAFYTGKISLGELTPVGSFFCQKP